MLLTAHIASLNDMRQKRGQPLEVHRVYVHSSMGMIPSLELKEGKRFSSDRKCKGNWTRKPRIFFSSAQACAGSSIAMQGRDM